jgi:hypothetical protein
MKANPSRQENSVEKCKKCGPLPGTTLLRINIPAGAVIQLLFLEITSPTGICLIIRIPPLFSSSPHFATVLESIRNAGGTIEFVTHED